MPMKKTTLLLLGIVIGLAGVSIWLGLLGMASPVLAQEQALAGPGWGSAAAQPPPPNDDDLNFIAFFTDELSIQIMDLSGAVVGEGNHIGKVKCGRQNCSQKTNMQFSIVFTDPAALDTVFEYKFSSRQAIDPVDERVVVAGKGTISRGGQQERFSFTATFQNNRDGTVSARYEASRPDASFVIPKSAGTFRIFSRH